ncbi:type VII secretion protein EccCa [Streptomyces sp. ACA25]|uniref:type VII secretion protein EccCa n=1 Tax=Streptomyces sp. ACA25 TaxID=3022596 RepID=UPI0023070D01|nr:type VII secretion protein EccCa [Streptomyces sp. ACA25]MDB1089725.1 type VII secretion protein EccCa [Streptomyces sp. ACA25]
MSQVVIKRPPRALPEAVPDQPLPLRPAPELPKEEREGVLLQIMPMLGMGSMVVFFFMPGAHPFMRIMGMIMMVSMVAMVTAMIIRFRRGSQGKMARLRRDYLKYLARTRREVGRTARAQRNAQWYLHPSPDQLWALVAEGSRVWERRPGDPDFGQVRIGLGTQQLATPLVPDESVPVDELEPLTGGALRGFVGTHGTVRGLPTVLSLRGFHHLTLSGTQEGARGTARAVVASLTALHAPGDLLLAVVAPGPAAERWEWTKWLPHVQHPGSADGAGARRLIGNTLTEVEGALTPLLEGRGRFAPEGRPVVDQPHVVLLLDGGVIPPHSAFAGSEGIQGVTIIDVVPGIEEARGGLTVWAGPGELRLESPGGTFTADEPDLLPLPAAEALARQLAPLRLAGGTEHDEPLLAELEFSDLLGLGDPGSVEVRHSWRPRTAGERLRVPIGIDEEGRPVMLDLKEAAQDGMGPHGLCVGATGSGKSELLRTLVLGLAVTHTSETLNFVLADFKGGATFTGMSKLPHVSAVITNLSDDLTLVDRMGDSIKGELQRRQELLRTAGTYANLQDYEKARAAGAPLEPLASLVIVIDEFSELLTAKPDFIDMFIQIGRIGRSLGVHLLLASQRLEEGRLKGLDTYLSYRIGLRTFSAAESRTAIGVPDAYHLPQVPGSGLLSSGTEEMTRFKAAYVSGPYLGRAAGEPERSSMRPAHRRPVPFTAAPVDLPPRPAERTDVAAPSDAPGQPHDAQAETVLDVIVRRLERQGPPAHQVWLPPLDSPPTLDQLLGGITGGPDGLRTGTAYPPLSVPLGLVDKPFEQRREPLVPDFSGAAGHMLVVGGPQAGKSTLLRTLVSSFALTHPVGDVQFYGLDFGGGGLGAVSGLPHVGGIASRLDPDRVRRTVAEVAGVLARREQLFREQSIDSMATFRARRRTGGLREEPWGDVFLLIDGWAAFRQEYDMTLEPVVTDLTSRGLGYGIHVVVTCSRYMDLRGSMRDLLTNRLELRLGDPLDSEVDRKSAAAVPADIPGRGLSPEKLHWMAALPRIDGRTSAGDLAEAAAAMERTVREATGDTTAPAVRMLPEEVPLTRLPGGSAAPERGIAVGIGETDLAPVFLDLERDPLLFVVGEGESGKSAALRLVARQVAERYPPEQARFLVADFRRSLLGGLPESHLEAYAPTPSALEPHLEAVEHIFEKRVPPADITPQQLRDLSWWRGPRIFVLIDDYELVASGISMGSLTKWLPYARESGVHFVIACSAAAGGRTFGDSFLQRFKELSPLGLVLSGNPQDGNVLGSTRARPLPPGRATLVSRMRGTPLVQLGWVPEV